MHKCSEKINKVRELIFSARLPSTSFPGVFEKRAENVCASFGKNPYICAALFVAKNIAQKKFLTPLALFVFFSYFGG